MKLVGTPAIFIAMMRLTPMWRKLEAVAHTLQGRYAPARRYAERLLAHVKPLAEQSAELEAFMPTLEQVLVAFQKWDEILALPEPAEKFRLSRGVWHYARAMALANCLSIASDGGWGQAGPHAGPR